MSDPWISEGTAAVRSDVRHWSKELNVRISTWRMLQGSCTRVKRSRAMTWATYAHVFFIPAVAEARSPWQATTPVRRTRDLPTSNEQVFQTAGPPCKSLSLAERQFVHRFSHPDMRSNLAIRPVCNRMTNCEVVRIVTIRFGQGVMREQLQAVREAMVDLDLKGMVDAVRVIAQIVALICGAAGQLIIQWHVREPARLCRY